MHFATRASKISWKGLSLMILNIKILKNKKMKKMKKIPGDIILLYIHVYHKWRSYDVWFLKHNVWQTEIFNILGHSLHLSPLTTWKIKILTLKKTPEDIIILHICTIFAGMVPEIWSATDIIFCHSGLLFDLLPHYGPRK